MSPKDSPNVQIINQLDELFLREMPHPTSSLAIAASYHFKNPEKTLERSSRYLVALPWV